MSFRINAEVVGVDILQRATLGLTDRRTKGKGNPVFEGWEREYGIKFVPHDDNGTMDDDLDMIFPSEHDYTLFLLKWGGR